MNKVMALKDKYKNIPLPVKASLWFAICSFLQKGISMITMPIFTRLLTTEQYGVYTIYQSWYSIISIFATLNLSAGVFYNGMIKYKDDKFKFTSAMQGLSTTVTVVLLIIYLIFHDFFSRLLGISNLLIIFMFIELIFVPAYLLWSARQRFDYQYKRLIIATSIITVMSPLTGVIAVISTDYKAEARILSYVGVQICVGLVIYIYNMHKGKDFFVKKYWSFALRFNIPLIPHYLSIIILGQADRIMIDKMVGTSEAAIYGVAYNISQLMVLLTTAISNSFNPYSYKAISEKKYKEIGKNANILLVIVGFSIILMTCFGPEIIRIFASSDYYDARWVIPSASLSIYFIFLYPLFSNIEFYFEANKMVMLSSIGGAIVNVVLNYLLIPVFGYIVAGYTTLFCYILFVVGHYIFHIIVLNKNLPGVRIYNMKFIVAFSTLLLIFVLSITLVYDKIIIRYTVFVAVTICVLIKRRYLIDILKNIKK